MVGRVIPLGQSPIGATDPDRRWRDRAACRSVDPELFFPTAERGPVLDEQEERAKAVCAGCPVRRICLTWALDSLPDGVAGGLTEDERRAYRRGRGRRREVPASACAAGPEVARTGTRAERVAAAAGLVNGGRPAAAVAALFGVSDRTVSRWVAETTRCARTGTAGTAVVGGER